MNYFAHTAKDDQGNRLPETHWQPPATHFRNAAHLAAKFAALLDRKKEAELAGLLQTSFNP